MSYLHTQLTPEDASGSGAVLGALEVLEKAIAEMTADVQLHKQVAGRLEVLKAKWEAARDAGRGEAASEENEFDIESASDDEVFALLDDELGLS
ncbi:hypothetical protein GCM10020000_05170 [Streptomyces olivoverticillatus]